MKKLLEIFLLSLILCRYSYAESNGFNSSVKVVPIHSMHQIEQLKDGVKYRIISDEAHYIFVDGLYYGTYPPSNHEIILPHGKITLRGV